MHPILILFLWLILFLPLAAAVGITLFALRSPARSAQLSIGAIGAAFGLSLALFWHFSSHPEPLELAVPWLSVADLKVDMGVRLDPLSLLMLLIVTGVGGAIHIYSWGYLRGDRSVPRFFASLSFFTFSMLGIVLANNFVQMFIFWELVGLSSYLLIGFWHERPAAADAAKKAFLVNRLGDFGFLIGILILWNVLGSVHFQTLQGKLADNPHALWSLTTVAGLLIFCGAMGKSAQFPLHVWLPDAMEGPTPVSALIHAATMVAAGVYMLCRVFFLFQAAPQWPDDIAWLQVSALDVIAWIGGITALLSALMAVQQNDIKRILAYSTLSQLGYMVMAVGVNGPGQGMYHLTTHAFFKALLFLGAGSVILALHHEQDIWKMGGLAKKMPLTYWTFLIGTLALCGVPPFSGFYSKDAILAAAFEHGQFVLFGLGVGVAMLTALYMFRLVWVAFGGSARSAAVHHAQESPRIITLPLIALAIPSALAGFFGIDHYLAGYFSHGRSAEAASWLHRLVAPFAQAPLPAWAGLVAVGVGFVAAWQLYRKAKTDPLPRLLGGFAQAMRERFYFDELYAKIIAYTQDALATVVDGLDRWILAGTLVRGVHGTVELAGRLLRLLQTGNLQTYALVVVTGVLLLLYCLIVR